jgi:GNAT superfamily N-acetyltransferase
MPSLRGTGAQVVIRRARPDEAAALTRLARAAKRHWRYPASWLRRWRSDLTVTPQFIRTHPVYCAVAGGSPIGFYALSHEGTTYELEHMWVRPDRVGRGVGRRLFRHARATARAGRGLRLTIASDPNAEGFYRAMGASRIGEVPSTPRRRMLPLLRITLRGARS